MSPSSALALTRSLPLLLGLGLASVVGCNALLDIADIEFGDSTGGTSAGGGGSGAAAGQGAGGTGTGTTTGTGTGTGTTGGGGQTTTGSGGTGNEGGSPCVEVCDDGSDNDGNNLVDCADPCCQGIGYVCVPSAEPYGPQWDGPVVYFDGPGAAPGCPSTWTTTELEGFSAGFSEDGDHTCNACSCGSPTTRTCNPGSMSFYSAAGCGGSAAATQAQSTTCADVTGGPAFLSAGAPTPTVSGGSCTASGGGVATMPGWSATDEAVVCSGPVGGGGCNGTDLCVQQPAGFEQEVCIIRNGNRTCDGLGAYTEARTVYGVTDYRYCSSCTCGTASASCSGTTTVYTVTGCTSGGVSVANDGSACPTLTAAASMAFTPGSITGGGPCTSAGGTALGSLSSDSYTLCCLP